MWPVEFPQVIDLVAGVTPCPSPSLAPCLGTPSIMPPITSAQVEGIYHPTVPEFAAALGPCSADDRARVLNFRLEWLDG